MLLLPCLAIFYSKVISDPPIPGERFENALSWRMVKRNSCNLIFNLAGFIDTATNQAESHQQKSLGKYAIYSKRSQQNIWTSGENKEKKKEPTFIIRPSMLWPARINPAPSLRIGFDSRSIFKAEHSWLEICFPSLRMVL